MGIEDEKLKAYANRIELQEARIQELEVALNLAVHHVRDPDLYRSILKTIRGDEKWDGIKI